MSLKRCIAIITILFILLAPFTVYAADNQTGEKYAESKLLYGQFVKPVRLALGENGDIYVLDGLTLKKYSNGRVEVVANMLADRERFAKYGLSEPEDIMTFRPGNMVYLNGAVYIAGYMMDRYLPPKEYRRTNASAIDSTDNFDVELGKVKLLLVRVTDHFEPIMVDKQFEFVATLIKTEYLRLLQNDRQYTSNPFYSDYLARFTAYLPLPNLVPSPDGTLYAIIRTACADERDWITYTYTDPDVGKLLDKVLKKYKDYRYYTFSKYNIYGLYKIYPDGRKEMLDEGELPSNIAGSYRQANQKHLSEFITITNQYMRTENNPLPYNPLIYAVPSSTDPENSVIVTNGHFIWKYNFKQLTCEEVKFTPGSPLYTADKDALISTYSYTPTMPRATKTLGIFFLGKHGVWRLYDDKYWQDLNFKIPWIDKTADWQIDENNRLIYYITRDGKLYSASFKHIMPIVNNNTAQSGATLKVIFDRNKEVIYGVNGSRGVYYEGDKLYAPIDPILAFLNINLYEDKITWVNDSTAKVPIEYKPLALSTTLTVRASKQGNVIQKHMPIDELMSKIYEITGKHYGWRYDPPTNTLYIEGQASDLPLFNGWW